MGTQPRSRVGELIAGRYRLIAEIGSGGMSVVYRAMHTETRRMVAVKLVSATSSAAANAGERLLAEARAVSALRHPNVVEVIDSGMDEGHPYLVLELLRGVSLQEYLAKAGKLTFAEALAILRPIMSAVAVAHRAGLVHRDLKPANIFLHREGNGVTPKLLDFGIAKQLDDDTSAGPHTQTGVILGTPAFMAPEQFEAHAIGPHTDVWSMGVVLYTALAGEKPFAGANVVQVLRAISVGPVTPVHKAVPNIPFAVAETIDRALRVEQKERYPDMGVFVAALEMALDPRRSRPGGDPAATAAAHEADLVTTGSATLASSLAEVGAATDAIVAGSARPSRARPVIIAAAALAVSAAVAAAFLYARSRSEPEPLTARAVPPVQHATKTASVALPVTPKRAETPPIDNEAWAAALESKGVAAEAAALISAPACAKVPRTVARRTSIETAIAEADAELHAKHFAAAQAKYRAAASAARSLAEFCRAPEPELAPSKPEPEAEPEPEARRSEEPLEAQRDDVSEEHAEALRHYTRSAQLQKRRDTAGAIAELNEAIELEPELTAAYNSRALLLQSQGELDRALADFGKALELEPKNASLYNNRALARKAAKDMRGALEDLGKAIALAKTEPLFRLHRAGLHAELGMHDAAIADYTGVLALSPKSAEALLGRGISAQESGDHNAAIADLTKLIALYPKNAEAYFRRGRSRADQKTLGAAIADFSTAIELNPHHAAAHFRRGLAYLEQGVNDRAEQDLTRFLELDPGSPLRVVAERQLERLGGPQRAR